MRRSLWLARCGLLGALALIGGVLEQLIPALPILPPGARPGIGNIAVLAAGASLGPAGAFAVALIKALFALFTRGVTAFLMSGIGGLLSTIAMLLLLRCNAFGPVGIGVSGAAAHNLGQILVACIVFTPGMLYYLPWMLVFSVLTGCLTGILFGLLRPQLERLVGRERRHITEEEHQDRT